MAELTHEQLQAELEDAEQILDHAQTRFQTAERWKCNGELPVTLAAALRACELMALTAAQNRVELIQLELKRREHS